MNKPTTLAEAAECLDHIADLVESGVNEAEGKPLQDAVKVYWRLKEGYAAVDTARKRVYRQLERMDKAIIPAKFEAADIDLIRLPELARSFYPQTKYSARQLDKMKLFEWLRENGHEDVITENVNASTLAGLLKDLLINEGVEIDPEIAELTSYKSIGSAKYTPKGS